MKRLLQLDWRCHLAAALTALTVAGAPAWMLFDRRPVVIINSMTAEPTMIKPGGKFTVRLGMTELRECDGEVSRQIISDTTHIIHSLETSRTMYHEALEITPKVYSITLVAPMDIHEGPARYVSRVVRWCNVFQKYLWPMRDPPLEVPLEFLPRRVLSQGERGEVGPMGEKGDKGDQGAPGK